MRHFDRISAQAFRLSAVVLPLLLASACSSIRTAHDYDTNADFSKLKTYGWAPLDPGSAISDLNERRVKSAVQTELGAKGFQLTDGDAVDFRVHMRGRRQDKTQVRAVDYGHWRYGGTYVDVYQYEEGTLTLDVFAGERLLWTGSATAALSSSPTPEKTEELIRNAVKKLLEEFPPR